MSGLYFNFSAFTSLDNFNNVSQKKKNWNDNEINLEPSKICDFKINDANEKEGKNINTQVTQCLSNVKTKCSNNFDK